jgi:hypothetical protein
MRGNQSSVESNSAMRNFLILACGVAVMQLFACSSSDNNSPGSAGSGGSPETAQGGSGSDTTAGSEGGTTSDSSETTATGGKSASATNSSGGKTSTTASSSGGTTSTTASSSGGTTSSPNTNPDVALTPDSPYAGKLAINELCPSNKTGAMEGGSYPDWVELYNSSSDDISLKGFYITDDSTNLTKFPLTKDTLIVKAGGVLLLWADGDVDEGDFHLGFKLSAAGETLSLLDPDQKVIDSVAWSAAEADQTYARLPDGTGAFSWCATGTPNLKNGSACK